MKKNSLIALVCLLCCALPALAQVAGDYRSAASGNWDAAATWQTYDGISTWSAATVKPGASNNVYLQVGFKVTLTGNEECNDLNMNNAAGDTIVTGANTLGVHGKIAAYSTGLNVFPVTYSTTSNQKIMTGGGGKISVVGSSRTVFNSGQWSANPQYWNLDIAMNPSQICSSATNIKAGRITVTSGTLFVSGSIRPDSGAANTGSILIAAGAVVHVGGKIMRTGAGSPCGMIDINGTLEVVGDSIVATTVNVNNGGTLTAMGLAGHVMPALPTYNTGSLLRYNGAASQTTRSELTANVYDLRIDNPNGVTLNSATNVAHYLQLQSGQLSNGTNNVTMANGSTILRWAGSVAAAPAFAGQTSVYYAGDYDITAGLELPATAHLGDFNLDKSNHRLTLSQPLVINGLLYMVSGELYSTDTVAIVNNNVLIYTSGWINAPLARYVAAGAPTLNFPVGTNNGPSPVTIGFDNVNIVGMLTVRAVEGPEPNALYPDSVLQRYWTISGDGALAFDHYDATFSYRSGDFTAYFTEAGDEATMVAAMYSSYWSFLGIQSLDTVNNLATLQGTSMLGDITLGKVIGAFIATADTTHPHVIWTSPSWNGTGVILSRPLVIAFSEPMNTGSIDGNAWPDIPNTSMLWNAAGDTLTMTHDPMMYDSTYQLWLTAGTDLAGNPLAVLPDTVLRFTTVANQAPVITMVQQPGDTYDGAGPFMVRAIVTDPAKKDAKQGLFISQLVYSLNGGPWNSATGVAGTADTFSFSFYGPIANGTLVSYYILAIDDQIVLTKNPANAPIGLYSFRILDPPAPTALNATGLDMAVDLSWTPPAQTLSYATAAGAIWDLPAGTIGSTRFTPMHYPCKLEQATSLWHNATGMDSVIVHVYADDGTGAPDEATELLTPFAIMPLEHPTVTVVDLSSYNIVLASGEFHIGYEIRTTGRPNYVLDGSAPNVVRSLYRYSGVWYGNAGWDFNHEAVVSYSSYTKGLALKSSHLHKGQKPSYAMGSGLNLKAETIANKQAVRYPKLTGALAMAKNISGYSVLRGDVSGGPYSVIGTASTPAYLDNTAANGTPYYYVVRATYSTPDTFSGWSNEISATPNGVEGGVSAQRYSFSLAAVRPNPVQGAATFRFTLPAASQAKLEVFNILGQRIRTVASGLLAAGPHTARWQVNDDSGRRAASGVYIYKLTAGNNTATQRLTLIR